jgi:hypothetical protein
VLRFEHVTTAPPLKLGALLTEHVAPDSGVENVPAYAGPLAITTCALARDVKPRTASKVAAATDGNSAA